MFTPSDSGFKHPEKKEDTQKKKGRCRLRGGFSTGAKTAEGRARILAASKLRHL
ncbi:MAG: HGGxSTG domain-containing protein [Gammaproteobacteria bacterium]|nr:HGGxSTG domain-containing protein [Gammaproteobacteria bacterium]